MHDCDDAQALLVLKLRRIRNSCLVLAQTLERLAEEPESNPSDQMDRLYGVATLLALVAQVSFEEESHD